MHTGNIKVTVDLYMCTKPEMDKLGLLKEFKLTVMSGNKFSLQVIRKSEKFEKIIYVYDTHICTRAHTYAYTYIYTYTHMRACVCVCARACVGT